MMKRTFTILMMLSCLSLVVSGQNLVQNPSFENLPLWDQHWYLSLTAPSTLTAIANQVSTDAHEGSSSVELFNTKKNAWTYYYTDEVGAAISFEANRSYEVVGWMKALEETKEAEFSIFWNGGLNFQTIFFGSPDPISNPDWFMVKDTITPTADFNDGYLRLGVRVSEDGDKNVIGRLLFDDFSVTLIPNGIETDITAFSFPGQISPEIIDPVLGTVSIEVNGGVDLSTLAPDNILLSRGATISPSVGQPQDFRSPVVYTVTAQDGITTRDWTVTVVHGLNTETSITAFSFTEETGPAVINDLDSTVSIEVAFGTNLSALVPILTASFGATVTPGSGIAYNFTGPAYYLVTAEDGVTDRLWTVNVTERPPRTGTAITAFTLTELISPATINGGVQLVMGRVPYGTDITTLIPNIGISPGASMDPLGGVPTDFTNPVDYRVIAEDGSTFQDWVVAILVDPNTETDIISFDIPELLSPATIDNTLHTVVGSVPFGTDLSALVPSIGLSGGAIINPVSDVARDFSSTVSYTVTADDGITMQDWTVTITEGPASAETDITAFSIPELTSAAIIDNTLHTIVGTVLYGTDVSALIPTIEVSAGATLLPASDVAQDFSSSLTYTVLAQDGSTTQDWVVSIQILPNTASDITSFHIPELVSAATIDNVLHTVVGTVPYGTNVTALVPTIEVSPGATINPVSGAAADFSAPLTYRVTAEDGTTFMDWELSIVIAPNTETDITDFSLSEQTAPATIDLLAHTVSIEVHSGTNLGFLTPIISVSEGATIDPLSGVSRDFNLDVPYTVTAEDGITAQVWTVRVTMAPANTETDITAFSIPQLLSPAVIDNSLHTVVGTVAYGVDLAARVPTIAISRGATINPASGVVTDLSSPVSYTVTAEDGTTTQDWLVTIQTLPNTETEVTAFSMAEETGAATIDRTDHSIDIEVASGTDLTSLVPNISVSPGATVNPAGGVSQDFTNAVQYTVTAEDGITAQIWEVRVSLERTVGIGTNTTEAIRVYPNPASEYVHIELSRETHIRMHDLMGKLHYSQDRAYGDQTINLSEFKEGIYIVSLHMDDGSLQQRKLIIR